MLVARNKNGGMEVVKYSPEFEDKAMEIMKKKIGQDASDKTLAELGERY